MIEIIDSDSVRAALDYQACIPLMREAMTRLSRGDGATLPRQIVPLGSGRAFGVMLGSLGETEVFGSKLVSVYPGNFAKGLQSHQGVIALFDPAGGAPVAIVHAGEITAIRTAAASAAATDALARGDATRLAILGYGEQAEAHIHAISAVRPLTRIAVWGRDAARRERFALHITEETSIECVAFDTVREAVSEADIICTTTAASTPILEGAWVAPGTHVNVVGSSRAGPVEVDTDLVVRARYFADCRTHVLAQGAEFLVAKNAGAIQDDHILAEIGEIFAASKPGRTDDGEITLYKSLGHVVQDLASAWHVYEVVRKNGGGLAVPF